MEEQNQQTGAASTVQQPEVTVTSTPNNMQVAIKTPEGVAAIEATTQVAQQAPPADITKDVQEIVQQAQQTEADLKADLAVKGVDFASLEAEFDKTGELSADAMSKLDKAGYPKSVVDAYLNGLNASAERFVGAVQQMAGGAESYTQLGQFIQTQGEGVRNAFNATIQSGNLGQIQLAISGLKTQMTQTYGTQGRTLMAGGALSQAATGYTTTDEMVKDMSDPRYQRDAKFTAEVTRKVRFSTLF